MRNGVKVLATSHYKQHNHICYPKDIGFYEGYHHRVENLPLNDYRNAMKYYKHTGISPEHKEEFEIENNYMQT